MLATTSTILKGTESFEEAFSYIPQNSPQTRTLYTEDGVPTNIIQLYDEDKKVWLSPKTLKTNSKGDVIGEITASKEKLAGAELFYNVFSKPTHAGGDKKNSWLIGDIDSCTVCGEDYNVQGLIISSIFDPTPKYYISFERLVCENQMSSLGTNNSSMYIDMNKFLFAQDKTAAKEKLQQLITDEVALRQATQEAICNKLKNIHLSEEKIDAMFQKLTVDKVAKSSVSYESEAQNLDRYRKAYNSDDNQNYKGTFMGFINTCTNYNTRTKTNPLDVVKPVISPNILATPCNFEYLCRDVLVRNAA